MSVMIKVEGSKSKSTLRHFYSDQTSGWFLSSRPTLIVRRLLVILSPRVGFYDGLAKTGRRKKP
jgi:hypothetical protein